MAGMSANRLVGHRIALIGEAAYIFPPLAAQGLNLSLRDVSVRSITLASRCGRPDLPIRSMKPAGLIWRW
jgi:2-polyprenyl-6-methoxyphenol hydroxylase-like FAD-dependent oxidoreductase